jgi:Protein of unknown function (DUF559)
MEYDASRTAQLEGYGYTVLRFSNEAVMQELDAVLVEILQAVDALTPSPSPNAGREEQDNLEPAAPKLERRE